uniref:hypothetical protein n=1 Tax=Thaumasiovibrio occultus TaxID=1891184 RepID=UPI000B354C6A|nr:hypothetical protein [Thaumasiovibrio occultus]
MCSDFSLNEPQGDSTPRVARAWPRQQQGSVLLVVIFVMVVMSLFAVALTRIGVSSQDTTTVEVLGARAWLAAHSGNEVAMNLLFPVDSNAANVSLCPSETPTPMAVNISGLSGCSVNVLCAQYNVDTPEVRYFQLTSTGACGSSDHRVSRVQELMAKEIVQ